MSDFLKNIFSTPILMGKADCKDICEEICNLAYEFKSSTTNARLVSDAWNYGIVSNNKQDFDTNGLTSYFSNESIYGNEKWENSANYIYSFANTMVKSLDLTSDKKLIMTYMWTTIYPPGAWIPEHIHSNSHLSGVFYARAKKNCGNFTFHDPSSVAKTMYVSNDSDFPTVLTKFDVVPEEGKMILFPSWLPHHTHANNSGEDRIIVSFNFNVVSE